MKNLRTRDSTNPLRIIALIFVFWALMTMAVSIPYVSLGPEEKAPDVHTGGIGEGGIGDTSSGDYLRALWMIFISILAVMFVAYTVIAALKKDREHFKSLFVSLLVLLLLVGILLGMSYLAESGTAEKLGLTHPLSSDGGEAGDHDSAGVVTHSQDRAFYAIVMMVLVLLVAVSYSVISGLISSRAEKVPDQSDELMEKIELAMKDLKEGKKVHDVIIRAYEEMCRILSGSGVDGEDSMTPREFQQAVISQTGIRQEPVAKLTALFEEARYSSHPIDDSKRAEALLALRDLKKEMERREMEESGGDKA